MTAIKRENGIDYPPRDYAYVPDPAQPASWRLRLSDAPGKISLDQLNRAAAALSPGGFRGNRVDIPQGALSSVKRRIQAEYRRFGVDEGKIPNSVKELPDTSQDGMMVWKEAETDRYRWFAVYSNNFRDNDNPPEIIVQKSHENFVEMVDAGLVDYPEAWLWHVPGTAWGKADWVAYADGFALASGYVYEGKEPIAQNLAKEAGLMVSHGMPKNLLLYDPQDPSSILFHITKEISPLPRGKAANKLTGFVVLDKGESTMPLPEEKKSWLKSMGLDDESVAAIDANLKSLAAAAQSAGIESKEQTDAEADEAASEEAAVVEEESAEAETEVKAAADADAGADEEVAEEKKMPAKRAKKKEAAPPPDYVTKEEVAGALTEVFVPVMDTVRALSDQLATVRKELADATAQLAALTQSDEAKIAATKEMTPSLSIADILAQNIIGKEATRIDGRTTLGKDAPVQKEAPAVAGATMVPLINGFIQGAQAAK